MKAFDQYLPTLLFIILYNVPASLWTFEWKLLSSTCIRRCKLFLNILRKVFLFHLGHFSILKNFATLNEVSILIYLESFACVLLYSTILLPISTELMLFRTTFRLAFTNVWESATSRNNICFSVFLAVADPGEPSSTPPPTLFYNIFTLHPPPPPASPPFNPGSLSRESLNPPLPSFRVSGISNLMLRSLHLLQTRTEHRLTWPPRNDLEVILLSRLCKTVATVNFQRLT